MFVACPHCGYLVALIVGQDGPARSCPRCGRALPSASEAGPAADDAAADDRAAGETTAPPAGETAAPPADDPPHAAPGAEPLDATNAALGGADDENDEGAHHSDGEAAQESVDEAAADAAAAAPAAPLPPLTQAAPEPAPRRAPARRQGKPETAVAHVRAQPSFVRSRARAQAAAAPSRRPWLGPLAVAVLSLALALQLLLAQRAELAADARWRPLVAGLCSALSCAIPPWREPAALTMLNRNVLPVDGRAGVLRVTASFRNDARWPQPWPTLVLSLDDVDGRRVGQRAFSPQDYRKGQPSAGLIAPGQSAAVQFDVLEPAPHVVAFTFDFR
ncbi:DUF3426 domain-containing protein [Lysobacter sp. BMK333-48F3]|nr:DUF3426 domain-containing protein [Lysobacter sp. BMK333-48F3]